MACEITKNKIDDYIDNSLLNAELVLIDHHIKSCAECRQQVAQARRLAMALRELPVEDMEPGFASQAIASAINHHTAPASKKQHHRGSFIAGFSTALAASVALVMVVALLPNSLNPISGPGGLPLAQSTLSIAQISIEIDQPQTVNLVFNTQSALQGATLTIALPEYIEIDGMPGQRQIEWQTDLQKGRNILPIPLLATASASGELIASVEQDGKIKTIRIQLTAVEPIQPQASVPQGPLTLPAV